MNSYVWVLLIAFALAAGADWAAVARSRADLESIAKPAVLVVLIVLAWLLRADTVSYGQYLLAGLGFSLIGDLALLGDSPRRFLGGLAAFLVAHLTYIAALRRVPGDGPIWPVVAAIVVLAVAVIWWRILPRARTSWRDGIPLLAYAVVLATMAALAWATGWVVLGLGATLFLVSDVLLAVNRFERELAWGPLTVHVTYHLGQLLMVWGMLRGV